MKIIIDPRSSYAYGSFYVLGLQMVFGKSHITYDIAPFKNLGLIDNDMRFILQRSNGETKVYIHAHDSYHILQPDYEWCDVYGCVNANFMHYPKEKYPKLISLAPSFGIRVGSLWSALWKGLVAFFNNPHAILQCKEWNKLTNRMECNPYANIKHHFSRRYKTWKNRLPISVYINTVQSEDNYIYFLSTLWYSDEWNKNDEGVNLRRALFIRACKTTPKCQFEGGLLGDNFSSNNLFSDVYTSHRETFPNWIKKTKRSALVFNTPAFWNCHGWKLGEYLALGKCIISTKLSNDLPYPLEHGKNIHFVEDDEESMREAIEYILAHPVYRHKLEQGAREYWEQYGTPEASLKLLGIE